MSVFLFFTSINFELTSIKQKMLNKQGSNHERIYVINDKYTFFPHLNSVYLQFCIFSHSLVLFFHVTVN